MVQLVTLIDSREKFSGKDRIEGLKEHVKTLTDKGVPAQVRTLVHGDVLWIARSRCIFLEATVFGCLATSMYVTPLLTNH